MKFNNRIKSVLIALTLIIICLPLAFIITVFTNPFWLWVENTFSIESVGHSGQAEWCYITVYLLLICAGGLILLKFRNRKTE